MTSFKDRSTGLMIFGILTILMGVVSGLLVLLILSSQALVAAMPSVPKQPAMSILPAILVYSLLAVAFGWLGFGSIYARRWARALLLVLSWTWLVVGTVAMIMMAIFLPAMMKTLPETSAAYSHGAPPLPEGMMNVIIVVSLIFDSVIFVVVPAIWTFFYSSRHVKATCEWRNPAPSWTDAVPLPVLAVCLWLGYSAFAMLAMPLMMKGIFPFFGEFLSGITGSLIYVVLAIVFALCTWLLYRLDSRGWWLVVITFCVFALSNTLTYMRHDVFEVYQLMGMPDEQVEPIRKMGLFTKSSMLWMSSVWIAPILGYLIYIKKYLR